jgi:hypothetical protein
MARRKNFPTSGNCKWRIETCRAHITDNGNFETVFRVLNRLARPLEKLAAGAEYRSPERGRPRESKEPGVYDWTLTMCGF